MDSEIVKVKEGWAVRLKDFNLERPFHYKKDAILLKETLQPMTRWQVESTYTLVPNHYFREYVKT